MPPMFATIVCGRSQLAAHQDDRVKSCIICVKSGNDRELSYFDMNIAPDKKKEEDDGSSVYGCMVKSAAELYQGADDAVYGHNRGGTIGKYGDGLKMACKNHVSADRHLTNHEVRADAISWWESAGTDGPISFWVKEDVSAIPGVHVIARWYETAQLWEVVVANMSFDKLEMSHFITAHSTKKGSTFDKTRFRDYLTTIAKTPVNVTFRNTTEKLSPEFVLNTLPIREPRYEEVALSLTCVHVFFTDEELLAYFPVVRQRFPTDMTPLFRLARYDSSGSIVGLLELQFLSHAIDQSSNTFQLFVYSHNVFVAKFKCEIPSGFGLKAGTAFVNFTGPPQWITLHGRDRIFKMSSLLNLPKEGWEVLHGSFAEMLFQPERLALTLLPQLDMHTFWFFLHSIVKTSGIAECIPPNILLVCQTEKEHALFLECAHNREVIKVSDEVCDLWMSSIRKSLISWDNKQLRKSVQKMIDDLMQALGREPIKVGVSDVYDVDFVTLSLYPNSHNSSMKIGDNEMAAIDLRDQNTDTKVGFVFSSLHEVNAHYAGFAAHLLQRLGFLGTGDAIEAYQNLLSAKKVNALNKQMNNKRKKDDPDGEASDASKKRLQEALAAQKEEQKRLEEEQKRLEEFQKNKQGRATIETVRHANSILLRSDRTLGMVPMAPRRDAERLYMLDLCPRNPEHCKLGAKIVTQLEVRTREFAKDPYSIIMGSPFSPAHIKPDPNAKFVLPNVIGEIESIMGAVDLDSEAFRWRVIQVALFHIGSRQYTSECPVTNADDSKKGLQCMLGSMVLVTILAHYGLVALLVEDGEHMWVKMNGARGEAPLYVETTSSFNMKQRIEVCQRLFAP